MSVKDTNTKEPNKYESGFGAPLPECVHMLMPGWEKGRKKKISEKKFGEKNTATVNCES